MFMVSFFIINNCFASFEGSLNSCLVAVEEHMLKMASIAVRGDIVIDVVEGKGLADRDTDLTTTFKDLSDSWVEVFIDGRQIMATTTIDNSVNPRWNARGVFPLCYREDLLKIKVWDSDIIGTQLVGETTVSLQPVTSPWIKKEWYPLKDKKGEIFLSMNFMPFQIGSFVPEKEPLNLDCLYFTSRKAGLVQLYHDADNQELPLLGNKHIMNSDNNAFSDMAESFENAKKFIYVAGWSVWTGLKLRRDGNDETLGELLKRKANDGVRVIVLIWNEKFSADLARELVGTHDQRTLNYFSDSKVIAAAVRRMSAGETGVNESVVEAIYSHHMKIIVADSPEKGLVGFIGGLDLTNGRWDTPEHPLWETLKTTHKEDFYNNFVKVTVDTGPREPWHDVHARVEGPPAFDLKRIFEERWRKQVSAKTNVLVPFTQEELAVMYPDVPPEGKVWHTQVLRNSDSDSSMFGAKNPGLTDIKLKQKDVSITHGLISLVRSCKKFIYIESQYFLGSAFMWDTLRETCAPNTVPLEVAEQICFGIRTGNPIRVYIVIPMCPESDPTTKVGLCSMNQILHWQFQTFQMMFRRIAKALQEANSSDHPEDYLLLLCLGKKNKRTSSSPDPAKPSEGKKWQQKSRFLIYVHSKMAIVDDVRVLVGSANFNQRSLDGMRDTEAAIAASQVEYEVEAKKLVNDGEVSQLRRRLWYEHTEGLSESDPAFSDPSSKECIAALKAKAYQSLLDYASDSVDTNVTFRFLKYPLQVEADGTISKYPTMLNMPDFPVSVKGKSGGFIPATITT